MLIGSAGAKSAHVPQVVEQLAAMGFDGGRLTFIAVLEIVSAILFLVSFTRFLGLLLASAFLGGAIATHLQHSQPIVQPAFVLL
jgi:DoxX-like family